MYAFPVVVDPSGKFAYVANENSNTVQIYVINPTTGALTSSGTVTAGTAPSSIATVATIQ
jgi:YVTN family beta-propeller protein